MIVAEPIPFREATRRNELRRVMPTNMGSAELREVDAAIRERAFFSARTALEGYLQTAKSEVAKLVEGQVDQATVRLRLKETLAGLGYAPSADDAGTIKDLSSDRRLDLLIKTNTEIAQGFGNWRQGQDAAILDAWPAQELFRAEEREEKRDWLTRWRQAGESTGPINSGWTITPEGRMVALKNHPIWDALGSVEFFDDGLGNPYPPFAFNSGMDVQDIDRDEAMGLGLIDRDTQIEPREDVGFELPEDVSLMREDPKPDRVREPREPEPEAEPVIEAWGEVPEVELIGRQLAPGTRFFDADIAAPGAGSEWMQFRFSDQESDIAGTGTLQRRGVLREAIRGRTRSGMESPHEVNVILAERVRHEDWKPEEVRVEIRRVLGLTGRPQRISERIGESILVDLRGGKPKVRFLER
jgi:hypothetical protein